MVEHELVERILQLIADETGWNPYFAYNSLSKDLRLKYSLSEILWLFHKLEWNVKVIEIDHISELIAWNPWKELFGDRAAIQKKSPVYRLRDEFKGWFYDPYIRPKFIEKVLQHLDEDNPRIDSPDLLKTRMRKPDSQQEETS